MKSVGILILSVLVLSFTSCKLCKNKSKETSQTDPVAAIIVQQGYMAPDNNASSDISKLSIEGNILTIELSYSGGCEEHDFKLYFNGNYKKSMPPKADFILVHDNKGDACRSIVNKTLKFDISGAQYNGQKKLMITVNGNLETDYNY